MRNFAILLMVALLPLLGQAQSKSEQLHHKYSNKDGFTSFSFSGSFMNDLDIDVDDTDDDHEKRVTGDLHEVKFMNYKHDNQAHKKIDFARIAMKELSGSGYRQVLKEKERDKDSSDETYFYAKGKKKRFSEFHVLNFNDCRTTLISFYGDFKVDELETLSRIGMNKIED